MSRYIEFAASPDTSPILVEVDEAEVSQPTGVVKAGLLSRQAGDAVASAQITFEEAVHNVVSRNIAAVDEAVKSLADPPAEIELTFGLKATGELGNIAIARIGGEANLSVRLLWKRTGESET